MNITVSEWEKTRSQIALSLQARWPWLVRANWANIIEVRVESPVLTMGAELLWGHPNKCAMVRIRVDSSACLTGGIADIAEAARMIAEVRDAMLFVHGATSGLVVWQDGECPCGSCSGRGTTQGSPCDRCDGKGKR